MKQGPLLWSSRRHLLSLPFPLALSSQTQTLPSKMSLRCPVACATLESVNDKPLTARERRQLRKERRESNPVYNWREEVEERLMKKPKKRYTSWTEELNLDKLALLGPQWWIVGVSRVSGQDTAERLARSLARNFPNLDFQVYVPAVRVKKKLKNGSYSVKPKPLFPGCVFLRCVLNKEIHDFIRECNGVGGFVGSKVGNTKRQINKPRQVSTDDMEAIFQQAEEEQKKTDQTFQEEQQEDGILNPDDLDIVYTDAQLASNVTASIVTSKPKRRSRKASEPVVAGQSRGKGDKLLTCDSTVRVVSGTFADFTGTLKKLDRETGEATVGFTLFGKETFVELDVNEIVPEMK